MTKKVGKAMVWSLSGEVAQGVVVVACDEVPDWDPSMFEVPLCEGVFVPGAYLSVWSYPRQLAFAT